MSLNVAIGFVTGRRHFQTLLSTYVNNWIEHGLIEDEDIRLHLLIAYDLKYFKTQPSDYRNIDPRVAEKIDSISFYGKSAVEEEKKQLVGGGSLSEKEADLLFGDGYAKKRNVVVYFAIKKKMDRLIFIDDDEYPISVLRNAYGNLAWMGQSMVGAHIRYSKDADITHGYHCGYISPIPFIAFNEVLKEHDFKTFISAISNEIISWKSVRETMIKNQGVTFADGRIINKQLLKEVKQEAGMKFISGANLCFNLRNCVRKLPPFFNPPGARGEDTFMSTELLDLKVMKIPVYTFHDGFLHYRQILRGALPITLEAVAADSDEVVKRFLRAAIGWVRYKPLMLYITQRAHYQETIEKMIADFEQVLPKICQYFKTDEFYKILTELRFYDKNVKRHFQAFEATKHAWRKLIDQMAYDTF